MRLRLVSVHLVNFRIHEDYLFTPGDSGITAISGRNGHGKSTIIDSISWALFGTRPARGLAAAGLKRQGAPKDAETSVDVRLMLDGHEVRVKRSIHGRATQCECWLDGNLEAGPAVSHASKWIIGKLGMDESTFLSTVLVQQKQVGALVESTPANRRRMLEKLTGISAVTSALELARDEENGYRRALDEYHVDVDRIPVLEKGVADADNGIAAKTEKLAVKTAKRDAARAEGVELRAKADALAEQSDTVGRYASRVDLLTERVGNLSKRQDEIIAERETLKKRLPKRVVTDDSIRELEGQSRELDSSISEATMRLRSLTATVDARVSDDELDGMRETLSGDEDKLAGVDRDGLRATITECTSNASVEHAREQQALKSIRELEDNTDGAHCPTCLQVISDVGFVKGELERTVVDARRNAAEYERRAREAKSELDDCDALAERVAGERNAFAAAENTIGAAVEAEKTMVTVKAEISALEAKRSSLGRMMMDAGRNRELRNQYDALLSEFDTVTSNLNRESRELDTVKQRLADARKGYTDKKLERARKKLEDKRAEYQKVSEDVLKLQGEINVLTEKKQSMTRELEDINKQRDARAKLINHVEVSAGNVNVLSAFRNDMIANAVPQITSHASDYIRQVTEGKYTDVEIDEKCNITVTTDDGKTRDVSMLSGGERDAVALCLRLAISVMLSGGEQSLMILDEPITSQDSNRAELMLNTIESMNNGQVIIVAHNEIIQSIADTIIEL